MRHNEARYTDPIHTAADANEVVVGHRRMKDAVHIDDRPSVNVITLMQLHAAFPACGFQEMRRRCIKDRKEPGIEDDRCGITVSELYKPLVNAAKHCAS
jgi:hypothetical protein